MWSKILHLNEKNRKKTKNPLAPAVNSDQPSSRQRHPFKEFDAASRRKNKAVFRKVEGKSRMEERVNVQKGNNRCLNASVGEKSRK